VNCSQHHHTRCFSENGVEFCILVTAVIIQLELRPNAVAQAFGSMAGVQVSLHENVVDAHLASLLFEKNTLGRY